MSSHHSAASAADSRIQSVDIADLMSAPIEPDQLPELVTGLRATPEPWSPDLLAERVGSTEVPVTEILGGDYMSANRRTMSIREYLDAKSRGSSGIHRYTPADFDLTADGIRARFGDYIERVGIPIEN